MKERLAGGRTIVLDLSPTNLQHPVFCACMSALKMLIYGQSGILSVLHSLASTVYPRYICPLAFPLSLPSLRYLSLLMVSGKRVYTVEKAVHTTQYSQQRYPCRVRKWRARLRIGAGRGVFARIMGSRSNVRFLQGNPGDGDGHGNGRDGPPSGSKCT